MKNGLLALPDHFTTMHDNDVIRDRANRRQIMGDEHVGESRC
ncbi:hypothetical protein [Mesorhizobium sp. LjNodule214]